MTDLRARMRAVFEAEVAGALAERERRSRWHDVEADGVYVSLYVRVRDLDVPAPTIVLARLVTYGAGIDGSIFVHGRGVWAAARLALADLLDSGRVGAVVFEAVVNPVLRRSLLRRGYREFDLSQSFEARPGMALLTGTLAPMALDLDALSLEREDRLLVEVRRLLEPGAASA